MNLVLIAAILAAATAPQGTPQEIVARFETNLRALTSFQADFEQTSTTSSLSTPLREKGRLALKKEDKMRWDYTSPEKKTFVFDAGTLLSYFPEDNQLWRQKVAPEDYESDLPAILSGKARLAERYNVETSPFPGSTPGSPQLKLTPKSAEEEGSFILIEIDPGSWMLRRALLFDWAGNKTEFTFSRFRPNVRLSDAFFEVRVPPGTEVIDGEPPRKK